MCYSIATALFLFCTLCMAADAPKAPSEFKSLNAEQARAGIDMFDGEDLDLSGLTTIDADTAKELAKFQGVCLRLNGLTSVDKNVAEELAKYKGALLLNGLTSIDKDVAEELAKFKGKGVHLNGLTSVEKEILKILEESNFYKTEITAERAAMLVAKCGDIESLWLSRINIDKEVARELAKHKGYGLVITNLKSIDRDVAKELATFGGTSLWLGSEYGGGSFIISRGIEERYPDLQFRLIDKDTAHELAKFQGVSLRLDGLTLIDKEVAQELVKFQGKILSFKSLTSIDKDVAHELAKFHGQLFLDELELIDKEVAQEFAKFKGEKLSLEGLASADQEVFNILKSYPPSILWPKQHLTDFADGAAYSPGDGKVWPQHIKNLTEQQAFKLATQKTKGVLDLGSLNTLTKDVARTLLLWRGNKLVIGCVEIDKDGCVEIDKETAEILARYSGEVLKIGLRFIDQDIAGELAQFDGLDLSISGLHSIDQDVARELARFDGEKLMLRGNGHISINQETAQELAKFKGKELQLYLVSINEGIAQELAKFHGLLNLRIKSEINAVSHNELRSSLDLILNGKAVNRNGKAVN